MSTRYVWEKFNTTYSLDQSTMKSGFLIYGTKAYAYSFPQSSFSVDSGKIVMTESIEAKKFVDGDSFSGYYYTPTDDDEIGARDVLEAGTVIPYWLKNASVSIDDEHNYKDGDGAVSAYKWTVSNTLAQGTTSYGKVSASNSGAHPENGSGGG